MHYIPMTSEHRQTPYYSVRTGKNPLSAAFDLDSLRDLFSTQFHFFDSEGYFQESLGYHCVDNGFVAGTLGHDLDGALLLELRKKGLTPIHARITHYSEEDLFDIIEFLYDHCSKPVERTLHTWNECGWHGSSFDHKEGKSEYRTRINKVLALYQNGYELSEAGEILSIVDDGLSSLIEAKLPDIDQINITQRVASAQAKFRRYKSSMDDRRHAVRDLADVLEYLRPQAKKVLMSKDESDIFEIANNFGIRHHKPGQKVEYDKSIWYSWIFYHYLSTIHAVTRLIDRDKKRG